MLKAEQLQSLAADSLKYAAGLGATQCAVNLGCGNGLQLRVRLGRPEQLELHDSRTGSVVVYRGKARASVSTNQLDKNSLCEAIDIAFAAAGCAAADECAGLADPAEWARTFRDLRTCFPHRVLPDQARLLALECEQAGLDCDPRLTNSEGAEYSGSESIECMAMYHQDSNQPFNQVERGSSYSLGCGLIGQGKQQQQAGYWYDTRLDFSALQSPRQVGIEAARQTLAKLDARSVRSGSFPVLFDPQMARKYWRMLCAGISGGALYRKSTLLHDKMDVQIFPQWLTLREEPHLVSHPGSANYDSEGVATRSKPLVEDGRLAGFLLGSYSARKLGMRTTANAGGVTNLVTKGPTQSFEEMLSSMGTGLIVRETMGSGLNLVSGDFSVGASGEWVENGRITHPVQVVTISSNLLDMFAGLVATGSDVDDRFAIQTGSVLLQSMAIGGSET